MNDTTLSISTTLPCGVVLATSWAYERGETPSGTEHAARVLDHWLRDCLSKHICPSAPSPVRQTPPFKPVDLGKPT